MRRKTRRMLEVEERHGASIEALIQDLVTEMGVEDAAVKLGIPKSTLGYWMLKCQLRLVRVVLAPGECVEVRRGN